MNYDSVYSSVIEVDGVDYLVQGRAEDELIMFREVDNLLECERDNVQLMMGEKQ